MQNSIVGLKAALNELNLGVTARLKIQPKTAATADNSQKLGGKTLTELVTDVNGTVTEHINNKNNPHGLTASQLNAFTKEEIVAMFSNYVPPNAVPISFFGNAETNFIQSVNSAGLSVSLNGDIPAMVAGRFVKMNSFTFVCTPDGKTWLYIDHDKLTLSYSTSFGEWPLAETQTKMLIGCVVTKNNTIVSHWVKPVRRIDVTPIPRVPELTNKHRVCSLGYVQTLYPKSEVGYWRDNIKIMSTVRGYQVAVLHPITGYVYRTDQFDTHVSLSEIERMTAFLKAIPSGNLTIIYSYDEVITSGANTNTGWINAMLNLGAPTGFQDQLRHRCAHVLLGRQNSGAGAGNSYIGGTVDDASDAVVDVNFYVVNNAFANIQRTV